jgi:hypothetical protein
MYIKTSKIVWKENHVIETTGVEDSQRNMIVDGRQILKVWENYITDLHDRANRREILDVETEEEVDKTR